MLLFLQINFIIYTCNYILNNQFYPYEKQIIAIFLIILYIYILIQITFVKIISVAYTTLSANISPPQLESSLSQ